MLRMSSYNSLNLAHNLKHSSPRKSLNILLKTFPFFPRITWKIIPGKFTIDRSINSDESKTLAENHYRKISLVRYRLETSLKCNFATTAGAHTHPHPRPRLWNRWLSHTERTKDGGGGERRRHPRPATWHTTKRTTTVTTQCIVCWEGGRRRRTAAEESFEDEEPTTTGEKHAHPRKTPDSSPECHRRRRHCQARV